MRINRIYRHILDQILTMSAVDFDAFYVKMQLGETFVTKNIDGLPYPRITPQ